MKELFQHFLFKFSQLAVPELDSQIAPVPVIILGKYPDPDGLHLIVKPRGKIMLRDKDLPDMV